MNTKDNEQYSSPQDKPKKETPAPQLPNDDREKDVRSGANQTDQLDKFKPVSDEDEAPNELGNPPDTDVNTGG